jgi:signal transduction histidine kinase/ActR/RegA family two-component response regulator
MQRIVVCFVFALNILFSLNSWANTRPIATLPDAINNIGTDMFVYQGKQTGLMTPPSFDRPDWKPINREVFATTPDRKIFWVSGRVSVTDKNTPYWLVLEPMAQLTQVFVDGHKVLPSPIDQWTPMAKRAFPHHSLIFPLPFKQIGLHQIAIRMEPKFSIRTPFVVVTNLGLTEVTNWQDLFLGAFLAVALVMLIYNLFIYFSVRDPLYLIYCVGVFFTTTYSLAILGALAYWLPDWMMTDKTGLMAVCGMIITHGFFVMYLLRTWSVTPRLHQGLKIAIAMLVLILFGVFWLKEDFITHATMPFALYIYGIAFYAGFKRVRQREVSALIFLIGWTPLFLVTTFTGFEYAGLFKPYYWTLYLIPTAQVWELLCFSLALASRINQLRDQRDQLQKAHIAVTESARDALQKSNQIKDHFLNAVSHELRTPLHTISSHLDMLRDAHLGSDQREALMAIDRANHHMTRQVGGILDFADAQSDQLHSSPQRVPLEGLLTLLKSEFFQEAKFKSVELNVHLDGEAPEIVYLDGHLLEKALYQLIDNAVKFTPAGGQVLVECRAQTEIIPTLLVWTITDTGGGIPPLCRQQVFKAFEQGEGGLTRRFSGIGLGLPLTQTIMRTLGGHLELVRSDASGTCVTCTVPYTPFHQRAPEAPNDPQWSQSLENDPPYRVLVVEDDAGNRMVLRKQLERLGFETEGACDGVEAVEAVNRDRWDLILMDCQMPIMDGIEATRSIRLHSKINSETPIVAVTANATRGYRQQCLDAGMNEFAVKPLRKKELVSILKRFSLLNASSVKSIEEEEKALE